jgi:hypothetical protein
VVAAAVVAQSKTAVKAARVGVVVVLVLVLVLVLVPNHRVRNLQSVAAATAAA